MIAIARRTVRKRPAPAWHAGFLTLLPQIARYANVAFRHVRVELREELVQEVLANTLVAYVRLVELGKADLAYPSVLARYAVAQIRDGRRVGSKLNVRDVSSRYAQQRKSIVLESLDKFDRDEGEWMEAVVEDHHTPVAEQVAFRLDFPRWLATFNRRDRRIAELLAAGHNTSDVARRFGLSAGRISQKRREYYLSWLAFHGEPPANDIEESKAA